MWTSPHVHTLINVWSCSYTHTHTRAQRHTHTHTRAQRNTHTHTYTSREAHTHTHIHEQRGTHTHTHTPTHTRAQRNTHTHTHTNTHTSTEEQTHNPTTGARGFTHKQTSGFVCYSFLWISSRIAHPVRGVGTLLIVLITYLLSTWHITSQTPARCQIYTITLTKILHPLVINRIDVTTVYNQVMEALLLSRRTLSNRWLCRAPEKCLLGNKVNNDKWSVTVVIRNTDWCR